MSKPSGQGMEKEAHGGSNCWGFLHGVWPLEATVRGWQMVHACIQDQQPFLVHFSSVFIQLCIHLIIVIIEIKIYESVHFLMADSTVGNKKMSKIAESLLKWELATDVWL